MVCHTGPLDSRAKSKGGSDDGGNNTAGDDDNSLAVSDEATVVLEGAGASEAEGSIHLNAKRDEGRDSTPAMDVASCESACAAVARVSGAVEAVDEGGTIA